MVGSTTALVDQPRLTVRVEEDHPAAAEKGANTVQPLRVVVDARGRVTEGSLMDTAVAPTLVYYTAAAPAESKAAWDQAGVQSCLVGAAAGGAGKEGGEGGEGGGVDMGAVLDDLGARGILQLMVEGGATLHGALLGGKEPLADSIQMYVGACVLGASGTAWSQQPIAETIADAQRWDLDSVTQFGPDVRLVYSRSIGT